MPRSRRNALKLNKTMATTKHMKLSVQNNY